jgi:tetratricopeptide (TPR) repeat protein
VAPAPEAEALDEIPDVAGGGFRALGWVFFSLVLLVGAAAVFYVANSESNARGPDSAEAEQADENKAEPVQPMPVAIPDGKKNHAREMERKQDDKPAKTDEGPKKNANKKTPKARPRGKGSIPKSDREAMNLLNAARGDVAQMHWDAAKDKYHRVVKSGIRKRQGYLGLANVAFQEKELDKAISFATKAGNGISAKMALANAHFKRGDLKIALKIYEQVLKKNPGHKEARKNAAVARKKLGIK